MVQPTQTRIRAADYYILPEYEQHDLIQLKRQGAYATDDSLPSATLGETVPVKAIFEG